MNESSTTTKEVDGSYLRNAAPIWFSVNYYASTFDFFPFRTSEGKLPRNSAQLIPFQSSIAVFSLFYDVSDLVKTRLRIRRLVDVTSFPALTLLISLSEQIPYFSQLVDIGTFPNLLRCKHFTRHFVATVSGRWSKTWSVKKVFNGRMTLYFVTQFCVGFPKLFTSENN